MKAVLGAAALMLMMAGAARADRAAAQRYFRSGAEAYHAQNFAAAADAFDLAYAELPLPEIAFSGAQAYRRRYQGDPQAGHVKRAIELYRAYLAAVKTGGKVREASDHLEALVAELRKLESGGAVTAPASSPARGTTRIGVSIAVAGQGSVPGDITAIADAPAPQDAFEHVRTTLDGIPIEPFALVEVTAGPHLVTAVADGYLTAQKQTVVVEGQASVVELELLAQPATLAITSEPGARIAIDGRMVAIAPTAPLVVAAGKHVVTITHRGRTPVVREVVLARGQALAMRAPLEFTERRRAVPWMLTAAGLSGGLAILTGATAVVRDHEASDLRAGIDAGNQPPSAADRYDKRVRQRDDLKTATWVFGTAAVASAALAIGLYLFDTPSAESVQITPVVTASGATIGVSGYF